MPSRPTAARHRIFPVPNCSTPFLLCPDLWTIDWQSRSGRVRERRLLRHSDHGSPSHPGDDQCIRCRGTGALIRDLDTDKEKETALPVFGLVPDETRAMEP